MTGLLSCSLRLVKCGKANFSNFEIYFPYISVPGHWIFEILISTPHTEGVIIRVDARILKNLCCWKTKFVKYWNLLATLYQLQQVIAAEQLATQEASYHVLPCSKFFGKLMPRMVENWMWETSSISAWGLALPSHPQANTFWSFKKSDVIVIQQQVPLSKSPFDSAVWSWE